MSRRRQTPAENFQTLSGAEAAAEEELALPAVQEAAGELWSVRPAEAERERAGPA